MLFWSFDGSMAMWGTGIAKKWSGGNILMQYLCVGYDRLSDADNKNDESSYIQSQKMHIKNGWSELH